MHDPLQIFNENDKILYEAISKNRELAFTEGAISAKNKFLIAMAIDTVKGATNGVRSLAEQAIKAGASKEEITETIRITYFITGAVSAYTAAEALKDLL